ncbi:hypothetical protein BDV96DRAFT_583438 [Lophiotrema nucula]|uniref:Uncharacterized protein n=1 Tax=Lophiotrema nucula TaxID=690887 RepID=A0A6A5YU03_9PLEO|nr:hypothetical protein BDV96DRAFT_583438 [Lophiotrema nucula]
MVRVMLPNAIIRNRRAMLHLFLARPDLPQTIKLRFDAWDFSPLGRTPIGEINPEQTSGFPLIKRTRPIFTSRLTPNGDLFAQWLNTNLAIPPGQQYPWQMPTRQGSELWSYIADDEGTMRGLSDDRLMRRLTRVMRMFWWISWNNAQLVRYYDHNWAGIDAEVFKLGDPQ